MKIYPYGSLSISRILVMVLIKVLFPDPVLPTTPIFSPLFMSKEISLSTIGKFPR